MSFDPEKNWLGWKDLPKTQEGRCNDVFLENIYNMLKLIKPKNILEIGFNGGHSACCFLNSNPLAKMYTFDICRWGIEEKAESVLKNYFDIDLIKGNSVYTVPEFLSKTNLFFDLIFIDGCHDYDVVLSDIKNTMSFLNSDGLMIIDDLHMGGVYKALNDSGLCDMYDYNIVNVELHTNRQTNFINKSKIFNKNIIDVKKSNKIIRPIAIFKNGKL